MSSTSDGKCEKAEVILLGKIAIIRAKGGGKALVGLHNICALAKRLGLCFENYDC